jgi:hypothetical protein
MYAEAGVLIKWFEQFQLNNWECAPNQGGGLQSGAKNFLLLTKAERYTKGATYFLNGPETKFLIRAFKSSLLEITNLRKLIFWNNMFNLTILDVIITKCLFLHVRITKLMEKHYMAPVSWHRFDPFICICMVQIKFWLVQLWFILVFK